ncbi:YdbC family protein [Shewanella sp. D64]|uniref:DUF4937 domain-containing protein n=1 Tax=unclassified Shewanella TaxID=196818 RepID=UPI002DD6F19A|nr:YdbC family protein [Shewanella sp. D64]MEC4738219.1 YdbC family protein [Shewanella sp. E94]WBJ95361.1 YdbC family protein [Shewanella sp. MTB7]
MITKYIRCEVPIVNKAAFSKGQSLWQDTAYSEGFRSQLGGWELSKGMSSPIKLMHLFRSRKRSGIPAYNKPRAC